jgi:hypothetical protein
VAKKRVRGLETGSDSGLAPKSCFEFAVLPLGVSELAKFGYRQTLTELFGVYTLAEEAACQCEASCQRRVLENTPAVGAIAELASL